MNINGKITWLALKRIYKLNRRPNHSEVRGDNPASAGPHRLTCSKFLLALLPKRFKKGACGILLDDFHSTVGRRRTLEPTAGLPDLLENEKPPMFSLFHKKKVSDYNPNLSRQDLIRKSRILMIDDEKPALIDDLIKDGFSVDYDPTGDDTAKIEKNLYDLIILDFGGVGKKFGKDQGLSLLKHIKRVNPAPFVLAYTSKSLPAEQSEFYRLTNGTLSKDAGIQESFAKIEESLRQAISVERIWNSVLQLALANPEDKKQLETVLLKCLKKKKFDSLYELLADRLGSSVKESLIGILVEKLIGLALTGGAVAP